VRVTVNGLAALYSSYTTPWDLQHLGMIRGPESALAELAVAFSGPTPWMPEMF
jgi:predicted acetyltransferase